MWRQRRLAKTIRDRMIRDLRARPPEQPEQPEQPPEMPERLPEKPERLPAEP